MDDHGFGDLTTTGLNQDGTPSPTGHNAGLWFRV